VRRSSDLPPQFRRRHDLTQTQLAALIGVSHQTLSHVLRGDNGPSGEFVLRIQSLLNSHPRQEAAWLREFRDNHQAQPVAAIARDQITALWPSGDCFRAGENIRAFAFKDDSEVLAKYTRRLKDADDPFCSAQCPRMRAPHTVFAEGIACSYRKHPTSRRPAEPQSRNVGMTAIVFHRAKNDWMIHCHAVPRNHTDKVIRLRTDGFPVNS
jgi:transcriptional regulator with XRE-family HTH domain